MLSLVMSAQSNNCFSLAAPVLPVFRNELASSTAFLEYTATGWSAVYCRSPI